VDADGQKPPPAEIPRNKKGRGPRRDPPFFVLRRSNRGYKNRGMSPRDQYRPQTRQKRENGLRKRAKSLDETTSLIC